jgi:hypothetical protein
MKDRGMSLRASYQQLRNWSPVMLMDRVSRTANERLLQRFSKLPRHVRLSSCSAELQHIISKWCTTVILRLQNAYVLSLEFGEGYAPLERAE